MPRRYVGRAIVELQYEGEELARSVYSGRILVLDGEARVGVNGTVHYRSIEWKFHKLCSGVQPRIPVTGDSELAYDDMARVAVTFGASFSREHNDPDAITACVIEEATAEALTEKGYAVRRKP